MSAPERYNYAGQNKVLCVPDKGYSISKRMQVEQQQFELLSEVFVVS